MRVILTYYFSGLLLLSLFISCNTTGQEQNIDNDKDIQSLNDDKIISSIGEMLSKKTENTVKSWEAFNAFDQAIQSFYAISNSEALSKSGFLADLSNKLQLSTPPEELDINPVKVRINILNSACQRLADMDKIPAIKPEEVTLQIKEVLSAYEMLKIRINALFDIQALESELTLDPDFAKILSDIPVVDKDTLNQSDEKPVINKHTPDKFNKSKLQKGFIKKKKPEIIKK